jgi:hypothetical protein
MADPIPDEQPPRSVATSATTAAHHIIGLLHPESLDGSGPFRATQMLLGPPAGPSRRARPRTEAEPN